MKVLFWKPGFSPLYPVRAILSLRRHLLNAAAMDFNTRRAGLKDSPTEV